MADAVDAPSAMADAVDAPSAMADAVDAPSVMADAVDAPSAMADARLKKILVDQALDAVNAKLSGKDDIDTDALTGSATEALGIRPY